MDSVSSNVNLSIKSSKLLELLARAKASKQANQKGLSSLEKLVLQKKPEEVNFGAALSLSSNPEHSEHNEEQILDFLQEITSSESTESSEAKGLEDSKPIDLASPNLNSDNSEQKEISNRNQKEQEKKDLGVARIITLNTEQQRAQDLALTGADFCFIGSAGTGKTTATGKIILKLIEEEKITLTGADTKYLSATIPGVLICSYTRKAVNNIRRAVPGQLKSHTLTLHKVLEFGPQFYEIEDLSNPGKMKRTMSFEPKRNKVNPLPAGLKLAIFEESSMISTELYNCWKEATPHLPQEIFIGDIQQLPPIFGPAILGFKMALLETVELKEVYRQALQSPIIRLAHAILSGDPYKFDKSIKIRKEVHPYLGGEAKNRKYVPSLEQYNESSEHGTVKFEIWQQSIDAEKATNVTVQLFLHWEKLGYYSPQNDVILCPFNIEKNKKGDAVFGCAAINKGIMGALSKRRNAPVHEIIAGFNKHYYAEGDRVLYEKEDAVIISIKRNTAYFGKSPQTPSVDLSRDGYYIKELTEEEKIKMEQDEAIFMEDHFDDFLLTAGGSSEDSDEGRVQVASHSVVIRYSYSEEEVELKSSADINNLFGGHALTVHKFQGSEEKNVFFILHKSHAVMVQRELLYTAVTRASKRLHILCESDSFFNGVKSAKVKGNTLAEKIEFFKELNKLKRPPVTLVLPILTQEGLVAAMADDKIFNYVVETINDQIKEAAKSQVAPATDDVTPVNRQTELDLSKLTLSYLANQPVAERRGGGISKETWAEFEKDYILVMDNFTDKDGEKPFIHKNNVYAANLFIKRLEPVKTNKPMLKKLQSRLSVWGGNTENGDELMEVYKFLDGKIENLLTKDDEDQLNSV
ncbi:unnamed protein product [Sphagnum jensenii]